MINVNIETLPSGEIIGFEIFGHSGYAESGMDIVCAAVSSVAYMVANTLTDVMNVEVDLALNPNGRMRLRIAEKDLVRCRDLLKGFKIHIILLEEQYPKNIKVNYLEV